MPQLVLHELGLVLAADHRLMDGVAGLGFLNRVSAYLEQPMKLLVPYMIN
jgi:pyruvate dehydrogenase E2 component (dihydrolipoamide acetyltransferase)